MKKALTIALTFVIAATMLTGCLFQQKLTAFGLYSRYTKKVADAGGCEMDAEISLSIMGINVTAEMNVKTNGDNLKMTYGIGGETQSTITIIGEDVYMDQLGEKYRTVMDKEAQKEAFSNNSEALMGLIEESFEGVEVIENEDGTKSLTLSLDFETVLSLMGGKDELFGSLEDEDSSIDFTDSLLTMNFDENDDLSTMSLKCTMKMSQSGLSLSTDITAEYTIINLGTAPEVSAPEDADDYVFIEEYSEVI